MATDDVVNKTRLTHKYPNAYSDFYGSGVACVYKTGPSWPVREGPEAQGIVREARPVYGHTTGSEWLPTGQLIYQSLDSMKVEWTSIDPLAYANEGEARPFCSFIVSIGVKPRSLHYDVAVAAADGVKKILAKSGFPDIEVAFVESIVTRSVAAGPKLLSFNPTLDGGTAGLYFRLGKENKRTAMLTCAHVARPPPIYPNTGMTHTNTSQAREEFVALGNKAYDDSVKAMMAAIGDLFIYIDAWNDALEGLGEFVEGEDSGITNKRQEYVDLVAKATKTVEQVNALHGEVTRRCTTLNQRTIGFVLHSEKIEVSVEPHKFTKDWALIELYEEKIDWPTFKGNKIYIGASFSRVTLSSVLTEHYLSFLHRWQPFHP